MIILNEPKHNIRQSLVLLVATALLTTGVTSYAGLTREKEIVLVENHAEQTVHTKATTVGELLEERGYPTGERLVLEPSADAEISDYMRVHVDVKKHVTIHLRGKETSVLTLADTVDQLLDEQGITLTKEDTMNADRNAPLSEGMEIVIDSVHTNTIGEREEIAFETKEQYTDDLYEDESRVVQEGKEGVILVQTIRTSRNGKQLPDRTFKKTIVEPVDEIIEYGTATRPQEVVSGGSSESNSSESSYSSESYSGESYDGEWMTFTATAYDPSVGDTTRMGTPARIGVVAVDPSVIPLGSTVVIDGYGTFSAEDTGSAIVGNKIDIFVGSYSEAMDFGIRTVRVKVVR